MKLLLGTLLWLSSNNVLAHGGGEVEAARIGKGVTAYDEHEGFKLSTEAQNRMKFAYKKTESPGMITIPREGLAQVLKDNHIYLHKNEFFKSIDVEIKSKTKDTYIVTSKELEPGTEVVVKGVNFLRVIEMDLNSGVEEQGDHHD